MLEDKNRKQESWYWISSSIPYSLQHSASKRTQINFPFALFSWRLHVVWISYSS